MEAGNFIPLESLQIATPCRADWNAMHGDERARFCQSCEKHVYNLAGMTRGDAERLVRSHEGEICLRLTRRADGTVITDDCPVGWRPARNSVRYAGRVTLGPIRWTFSKAAMLLAPLFVVGGALWAGGKPEQPIRSTSWSEAIQRTWLYRKVMGDPQPTAMMTGMVRVGRPAMPLPASGGGILKDGHAEGEPGIGERP